MLIVSWLGWWYSTGWWLSIQKSLNRVINTLEAFSMGLLVRTLFQPWKQIVAYKDPSAPLPLRLRNLLDNLVSRGIGFSVRVITMFTAIIVSAVMLAVAIIQIVAWPLVPLATLWAFAKGLGLW